MRNKKVLAILALIFFSLTLVQTSEAIILYLRPAKYIIHVNITEEQTAYVWRVYEIQNRNNFTMRVDFQAGGDIQNLTKFSNPSIAVRPNQTRYVNFTIEVPRPGFYNGTTVVSYVPLEGNATGAAITSEVFVLARGVKSQSSDLSFIQLPSFYIPLSILILAVLGITFKKFIKFNLQPKGRRK